MNPIYQSIARAGGIDLHSQISRHQLADPVKVDRYPEIPATRILTGWFISQLGKRLKAGGDSLLTSAEKLMQSPTPLLR